MKYRKIAQTVIILSIILLSSLGFPYRMARFPDIFRETVPVKMLKMFPDIGDNRNIFFLQSIDDTTSVIIADYISNEKVIAHITDRDSDGKVDEIIEYLPDTKRMIRSSKPRTQYYTDFDKIKREIINGKIFRNSYTYMMESAPLLEHRLKQQKDIYKKDRGYNAVIYDPDNPSLKQSEFFFMKKHGRYYLKFVTYYYYRYNYKIAPPVMFSVYCENSKDKVVKEIVESLLETAKKYSGEIIE